MSSSNIIASLFDTQLNVSLQMQALAHLLTIVDEEETKKRMNVFLLLHHKRKGKTTQRVYNRKGNIRRDRVEVLLKIFNLNDATFRRMFRMDQSKFNELLCLIKPRISVNSLGHRLAVNSSGSVISPAIKLCLALRFLAGGSYLDIAFAFNVSSSSTMGYIWEVIIALDEEICNIEFPINDERKLRSLEEGFASISNGAFRGTVAAGDGVVFRMQRPNKEEVNGDVASFYTRKGFYAYGMQGFVDSSCRFLSISMKMCSSAHDSTAYIVSDLSNAIKAKKLPSWAHIVLDEAYLNTEQELSPYRGRRLDQWKDSFNYHLSLHRQVVERAFGILIQRWGVFWRPLRVSVSKIPLLIRVACKLHNFLIGDSKPDDISRGDVRHGDLSSPLFTDGTGSGRGGRSDLEESNTRAHHQ